MKRYKKLVLTVAALAALTVGGSAFAQAQVAKTVTQTTVQHQPVEPTKPGDPADGQDTLRQSQGNDGEHQDQGSNVEEGPGEVGDPADD
jgi:hypothetical protein